MKGKLPLEGLRVVELTHMVMGPAVGLVLADLGAEIIKIEPVDGDATRRLKGSGAGYFPMYNRNKKSFAVNLKAPEGAQLVRQLVARSDVFIENFRPGTADRLGLGYDELSRDNPRLVYCSGKGFLSGPYEHRTALDEICQMMGGLAYMTGPSGRPLRAGSSVVDVTGGMFGALGILAALYERHHTERGRKVTSSLFETTVFLVGQHMAQFAVTGQAARPMPERISAWAVYDVFDTKDNEKIFVGVVSDKQWSIFCEKFGLADLAADPTLQTNEQRVDRRDVLLPAIRDLFGQFTLEELTRKLEDAGLPFAPIARPEDMFEDPHLLASGGLLETVLPEGKKTRLPALPLQVDEDRPGLRVNPPRVGEHTQAILSEMGMSEEEISRLREQGVIAG
ncbi:MAG: CoA transferase [Alphaproteobacteria bacterium]|nr:MAG: CoA transferase [Alphaproteobacteria bacterium]